MKYKYTLYYDGIETKSTIKEFSPLSPDPRERKIISDAKRWAEIKERTIVKHSNRLLLIENRCKSTVKFIIKVEEL